MSRQKLAAFFFILFAFLLSLMLWMGWATAVQAPPPVHSISVIVRGRSSDTWSGVKQGAEQAADESNVELSFITLSRENDVAEQTALLERECAGGADALVLAAADSRLLAPAVDKAAPLLPVVCIESGADSAGVSLTVAADDYAMGACLAEKIVADCGAGAPVRAALLLSGQASRNLRARREGAEDVLLGSGYEVRPVPLPAEPEAAQEAMGALLRGGEADVLVATDPAALEAAGQAKLAAESAAALYGIGTTGRIAAMLEGGTIRAAIAQNDFSLGYLGVRAAVERINGQKAALPSGIEYRLITRGNMYDTQNQRLLFPFVR